MKKNILIIACCVMLLSISNIAYSADGLYVSGNLGLSIPSDSDATDSTMPGVALTFESDNWLALGAAAGYDWGNMRIEGELTYRKNDFDKATVGGVPGSVSISGDTSSLAFLLNGYFDFKNESAFTPFISAGVGLAKVGVSSITIPGFGPVTSTNYNDIVFAYQVGAGVGFALTETVSLDFKYFYFGTHDPDFSTTTIEYSSHNIYFGIRVAL